MPRLKNANTGAVVSCSDDTASRLGSEWVPVEVAPVEPVKRSPGRPKKTEE